MAVELFGAIFCQGDVARVQYLEFLSSYSEFSIKLRCYTGKDILKGVCLLLKMITLNILIVMKEMKVSAQNLKEESNEDIESDLYKKREDRIKSFLVDLHNKRCSVYEDIKASTSKTKQANEKLC